MAAALRIVVPLLFFLILAAAYSAAQADQVGESGGIEKQLSIFEKLQDYNVATAESTLRNVSFLIAFLGGILSFLAPCTVALFPAFLAYTTKAGRNLTLATLIFFAGFSLTFVALGITLTALGRVSFATFQQDISIFVRAAGVILIFLGLLMFFGKGFSFIQLRSKLPKDAPGTFLFGGLFAIGWTACIGPIIAGIFIMATVFHNYSYAAILLLFYALGLAVPLFLSAFAYDRFNLAESKMLQWLQGLSIRLAIGKKELLLTPLNVLSGLLLILLGLFFIINGGTAAITAADLLGMIALLVVVFAAAALVHKFVVSRLVSSSNARKIAAVAEILAALAVFGFITKNYEVRTTGLTEGLSRAVLENTARFNFVAAAILIAFIALLFYFVKRQLKSVKGRGK